MIEEAPERDSSFVDSEYNDEGNYKDESFSVNSKCCQLIKDNQHF